MTSTEYSSCSSETDRLRALVELFVRLKSRNPFDRCMPRSVSALDSPIRAGRAGRWNRDDPSPRERRGSRRRRKRRCRLRPHPLGCSLPLSRRRRSRLSARPIAVCAVNREMGPSSRPPASTCRGGRVRAKPLQGRIDPGPTEDHVLFRVGCVSAFRHGVDREQVPQARPPSRCRDRRPERRLRRDQRCRRASETSGEPSSWAASSSTSATRTPRAGCRRSSSVATGWSRAPSSRTTSTPDSRSRATGRACPESTPITTADTGLVVTPPCVGCPGPAGVVIEDSEIAFNNTRQLSVIDDAGGTKFSGRTRGMIVRHNDVHDNYGAGSVVGRVTTGTPRSTTT